MSSKKFDVHQSSRMKQYVVTLPNGKVLQFDNEKELNAWKIEYLKTLPQKTKAVNPNE